MERVHIKETYVEWQDDFGTSTWKQINGGVEQKPAQIATVEFWDPCGGILKKTVNGYNSDQITE
jgi:hypothetical protein